MNNDIKTLFVLITVAIAALMIVMTDTAHQKVIDPLPTQMPDFCRDEGYQPYGPCKSDIIAK